MIGHKQKRLKGLLGLYPRLKDTFAKYNGVSYRGVSVYIREDKRVVLRYFLTKNLYKERYLYCPECLDDTFTRLGTDIRKSWGGDKVGKAPFHYTYECSNHHFTQQINLLVGEYAKT